MRWLRAAFGQRKQRSVELTPDEMAALKFLLEQGEAPVSELHQAIVVAGGAAVTEERVDEALAGLHAKGLMTPIGEGGPASFRPTETAERLRDRLPAEPRSVMQFYL